MTGRLTQLFSQPSGTLGFYNRNIHASPPQSTQKPRICSPSNLLHAGLSGHHRPRWAGPGRANDLLCAPVTVCSCGSQTHFTSHSASLRPQQPHSFPAWDGAPRQSQSLAHSQHPGVLRGLSEQRLLSGPTHVARSWRGGRRVPFSSFHAGENMASLLVRPPQRTGTETLSL